MFREYFLGQWVCWDAHSIDYKLNDSQIFDKKILNFKFSATFFNCYMFFFLISSLNSKLNFKSISRFALLHWESLGCFLHYESRGAFSHIFQSNWLAYGSNFKFGSLGTYDHIALFLPFCYKYFLISILLSLQIANISIQSARHLSNNFLCAITKEKALAWCSMWLKRHFLWLSSRDNFCNFSLAIFRHFLRDPIFTNQFPLSAL